MTKFVVDVEADGPVPGLYSMIEVGVVVLDDRLQTTFYTNFMPITQQYKPEALAVTGYSREETFAFADPEESIKRLEEFVKQHTSGKRSFFVSDNPAFDFAFVNYYMWKYLNRNIFGHSAISISDLYKGLNKSMFCNFKHLRDTKHTHNPVDDAMGNAEALLKMINEMGLKIGM